MAPDDRDTVVDLQSAFSLAYAQHHGNAGARSIAVEQADTGALPGQCHGQVHTNRRFPHPTFATPYNEEGPNVLNACSLYPFMRLQ